MVHDFFRERYMFLILTEYKETGDVDDFLNLPVMEQAKEPVVVGVIAIILEALYMVEVRKVGVVWVKYNVHRDY